MENVSKALLMSASVLIALLIVSVATRLFKSASQVTKSYDSAMSQIQISTFNSNFTKFMGDVKDDESVTVKKYATIYDVISTATFAYDYNSQMVDNPRSDESKRDTGLVKVDIESKDGTAKLEHLQIREDTYDTLMQNCYYQNKDYPNARSVITYEITINASTSAGLIRHVTFTPMEDPLDLVGTTIRSF